jgi:hypothetical protein
MRCEEIGWFGGVGGRDSAMKKPIEFYDNVTVYGGLHPGHLHQIVRKES